MLCDMATPKWAIYLVNDAWHRTTGISHEMAAGGHFWDLFEPPAPAQVGLLVTVVTVCSTRHSLSIPVCVWRTVCCLSQAAVLLMVKRHAVL
jgi:hypothetical protein